MNKLRFFMIVTLCVLAMVAVWVFFPAGVPRTDEARFQRWKQTVRLSSRAMWWDRHLPFGLGKMFHLRARETKYWNEHAALGDTLVDSGFFTNAPFAVAAVPTNYVQRAQVADRLGRAFQHRMEWEFWVRIPSNQIVVTCRPQDVDRCRQALQE